MAEGGGLLNRYTVQSRIKGSNPFLSATLRPSGSGWRQASVCRAPLHFLSIGSDGSQTASSTGSFRHNGVWRRGRRETLTTSPASLPPPFALISRGPLPMRSANIGIFSHSIPIMPKRKAVLARC